MEKLSVRNRIFFFFVAFCSRIGVFHKEIRVCELKNRFVRKSLAFR